LRDEDAVAAEILGILRERLAAFRCTRSRPGSGTNPPQRRNSGGG